jgi:hypothetical protein
MPSDRWTKPTGQQSDGIRVIDPFSTQCVVNLVAFGALGALGDPAR